MGEEASVAEYKRRRTVDSKWRGLSSMYLYTSVSKHGWFNQQKWGYNWDLMGISIYPSIHPSIYLYNEEYDIWVCPKMGSLSPFVAMLMGKLMINHMVWA